MPMDDADDVRHAETETHAVKTENNDRPLRPAQGNPPSLPPRPNLPKDSGFADFGPEPSPFKHPAKNGW